MKLYKEGDLGKLNMVGRIAYVRSLASKYNLKESIQNSYGVKVYVYYLNPVCNSHILHWFEESDHVDMATEFRVKIVNSKERLYAFEFHPEYSTRNIERRLANYTKQAKDFMVKMKKQDIEDDFKST
ncbi:MAG: hypothetical protein J6T74_02105 [Clostridia bacterium]|nr:hypothetical protein [Clostridia bacterium]